MEPSEIVRAIVEAFDGVEVTEANGDSFLFAGDTPADQRMPFATVVTSNAHDRASNLDVEGAFRLNVGVSRATYEARFGAPPPGPLREDPWETGYDYASRDLLMPHPVYSPLNWVCVVNPSLDTFEVMQPLLAEAYDLARGRKERRERTAAP